MGNFVSVASTVMIIVLPLTLGQPSSVVMAPITIATVPQKKAVGVTKVNLSPATRVLKGPPGPDDAAPVFKRAVGVSSVPVKPLEYPLLKSVISKMTIVMVRPMKVYPTPVVLAAISPKKPVISWIMTATVPSMKAA